MKKLYIILTFLTVSLFAQAQDEQPPVADQKQQEKIEALKVITGKVVRIRLEELGK